MSQKLLLEINGLETARNQLSGVSVGGMSIAKNVVIDNGYGESRRGFVRSSNINANYIDAITGYQSNIISRRSDNNTMQYLTGTFSGTYQHPDSDYGRMKFLQAASNLYFTESTGVKVLNAYNGTIYNTGMPKGLDGVGSTTGASGMMSNNTQVAYRVVWGAKDVNNNLFLGAPSQRIIVANTSGGTRDVSLTFTIPSGITTSAFFQVYRSKESASSTTEPNDELYLVYETNPTSGEISAKAVTFTDSTPVSLMGAALYTNSSQEGIQESNDEPPWCTDLAEFKGYVFFSNIKKAHFLNIKLLSCGGSSGLVADDTITIDGTVYTAKASETIASGFFKVFSAGTAAQNIDDTARSLVKVINQYATNTTIYAYYTTGYNDLPGQILLKKRTIGASSFTATVSRATAWDLDDGTSDNEQFQNAFMWSKNQQPEHVPSAHIEYAGSKASPIYRTIALRDSVFFLKTDGVYRLTGSGGVWNVEPFDTSTKILAPESAVVINNQIICLADQGVVAISDVGVQVLSEKNVKDQITELIGLNFTTLKTLSYGIAYETDHKYILNMITTATDTYPTQSFVMNTFSNRFVKWNKESKTGFVDPSNNKLVLASPLSTYLLLERKSYTYRDYVDEEMDGFSVVSSSNYDVVLNTVSGLTVGDLLYESATVYSPITAISASTNTVTVNDIKSWTVASITILKGIDCEMEWAGQHCDNPGVEKSFQEIAVLFREKRFNTSYVDTYTDLSGGYESVSISGSYGGGGWGLFNWGELPWGGIIRPSPVRMTVPRNKNRGTIISIRYRCRVAYAVWAIQGLSLQFEFVTPRLKA